MLMRTASWSVAVGLTALLFVVASSSCDSPARHRNSGSDEGGGDPGSGGAGSGSSSSGTPAPEYYAVPGVAITKISLYQGVERPLMADGQTASSTIPIVQGRDALLRVFVSTDASYGGQAVTGRLAIIDMGEPLAVTQTLPVMGVSQDSDLGSTLNFNIPGAMITANFQYQVTLVQLEKADGAPTSYPAGGFDPVGAQSSGAALKVQIVPVMYGYDGSNRVPDTSQAILDMYRDGYFARYPVASVEITLHDPVPWNKSISAFGNGWDSILQYILDLRQQEGAAPDQYYFGVFAPKATFGSYCSQGCVLGLAPLGQSVADDYSRAAVGAAYGDEDSIITAIHETGHNHGREHAPCQTQDADANYPHPGGQDGVWGYNLLTAELYTPKTPDFMGYCTPSWISDYTFNALFKRIKGVNKASIHYPAGSLDRTYDRMLIDAEGKAQWAPPIKMRTPPMAEPADVVLETAAGEQSITGQLYRYDHLPGGILFMPQGDSPYKAARVTIGKSQIRLAR